MIRALRHLWRAWGLVRRYGYPWTTALGIVRMDTAIAHRIAAERRRRRRRAA